MTTHAHANAANANAPVGPLPDGHPRVAVGKTAVLLVNLGTPDATTYGAMRRYLSQFLSDKRVIEYPMWLWQPLLQGIILTVRPSKSGAAYKSIWNTERDESPLRTFTRAQAEGLADRMGRDGVVVDWAMRYGQPSIPERLQALQDQGCDRILVAPLYPQYSATTTATVVDEVSRYLLKSRWQPAIRTLPAFHDHPAYIDAIADGISDRIGQLDWEPEVVLLSFHGLPQSYFKKGDPYHCHCHKTARLVRERLGWSAERMRCTFQSRFGPAEWLQPYTDKTLEELAASGVKRVAVATPGFVSDCVETLEEMAIEGAETFLEAGGEAFDAIPCLNATDGAIAMLETLARQELGGWINAPAAQASTSAQAAE